MKPQNFGSRKDFSSQSGYIPRNAFDPRRYEGNFTASIRSLGEAPTQVLSYAETAYQYFSEEGIKAIYFPTADDGGKYQARVKLWGAVARESSRKELAFELLRQLMDEDIDSFGAPWGIGEIPPGAGILNVNVYPVNIENAVSFLDRFENQSAKLMYGTQNATILDRADISEVEKEKHAEMLSSISGLFCWNKELEKIDSIFDDYYTANITDYENCYIDMLNSLNAVALTEKTLDFNDNVQENGENSNVIEKEYEVSDEAKLLKEKIRNTKIGETFFFGETEQDNDFDNGAEPIEWIVLEKKEDKAFVISKKIIEWLTFSKYDNMVVTDEGVRGEKDYFTWDIERNQQRIWLTNDLYENGFSEIEKEIILLTHIKTDGSSYEYDDYLYIPSEDDVETYLTDIQLRQAEMTVYVAKKANQFEGEFGCWSLRSKLMLTEWKYTVQIKENGEFGGMYTFVPNGVRPVMWLDIS